VPDSLADNYRRVSTRIAEAAERAGRDPEDVRIVAVTKTIPIPRIRDALGLGLHTFGENRVQEALPKIAALEGEDCEWHLIGHLQTNKAKFVPRRFAMIQSIDNVRVVEALATRAAEELGVLVEVNAAEESQKTGVAPTETEAVARAVQSSANLRLKGLMTMAPLTQDPESVRPVFRRLRELRDDLSQRLGIALPELSMGMTDDYPVAVEEGATMLRLGRALFGSR